MYRSVLGMVWKQIELARLDENLISSCQLQLTKTLLADLGINTVCTLIVFACQLQPYDRSDSENMDDMSSQSRFTV